MNSTLYILKIMVVVLLYLYDWSSPCLLWLLDRIGVFLSGLGQDRISKFFFIDSVVGVQRQTMPRWFTFHYCFNCTEAHPRWTFSRLGLKCLNPVSPLNKLVLWDWTHVPAGDRRETIVFKSLCVSSSQNFTPGFHWARLRYRCVGRRFVPSSTRPLVSLGAF